jgi:peptidoglycan/xylan/chitin deacetylase (PgdA/CDA1 family)
MSVSFSIYRFSRFYWSVFILTAGLIGVQWLTPGWREPLRTVLLLGFHGLLFWGVFDQRLNWFLPVVRRGRPDGGRVALTFDDGPDPEATPAALDVLDRRGVRATFFVVGEKAAAHPDLVQRAARAGHVIGNHSWHHHWWTNFKFGRALVEEIGRTNDRIEQITGRRPIWFRPPMGLTNPHLGRAVQRAGVRAVGWDVRTLDTRLDPDRVVARIRRGARSGSIILAHDRSRSAEDMAALVDRMIDALEAKGLTPTGLDQVIGGAGRP